ncbi:hypothetical protein [Demequina maris]|uniref:hypothetical protein n=1 Tax=Demequina maris TaxID=1638982 RepID=UPI000782A7F2|nr:hypothetical protein [Demequina maris]
MTTRATVLRRSAAVLAVAAVQMGLIAFLASTFGFWPQRWGFHRESAPAVERTYLAVHKKLFYGQPGKWGGAYIDGDVVVLRTVTRSKEEAEEYLESRGMTGPIEVVEFDYSIADLNTAKDAVAEAIMTKGPGAVGVTKIEPDSRGARLIVGVDYFWHVPGARSTVHEALDEAFGDSPLADIPVFLRAGERPVASRTIVKVTPRIASED